MKTRNHTIRPTTFTLPMVLASALVLGACGSSTDDDDFVVGAEDATGTDTVADTSIDDGADADTSTTDTPAPFDAFAAIGSFSAGSGQIVRLSQADGFTINAEYPSTTSDIRVATDGESVYQIGRFQLDSITKFDADDTSSAIYQYSVNGEEISVNPHSIVFASETKAYVLRYGSPLVWIVNPSATSEDEFLTGTIDLSAYDPDLTDEDLSPNATSGVIVDGKLYILMQRLSGFSPIEQGYVAVIDVATDTEIETGQDTANGLAGIPLGTLNPDNIRYNATTDEIYLTGRGNLFVEFNMLPDDPFQGGLFAIDDETFMLSQYLDDGDTETNNGLGFIGNTIVASETKGYVSLYATEAPADGSSREVLHTFNLATGEIGEPVAGLEDQTVVSLNTDNTGVVWVGVSSESAPGYFRLNAEDDSIIEPFIATPINPLNLVFIESAAQ